MNTKMENKKNNTMADTKHMAEYMKKKYNNTEHNTE